MCCNGIRTDHHVCTARQHTNPRGHQRPQASLGPVADHGAAHGFGDNKTDPRRLSRTRVGLVGVDHDQRGASSGSPGPPKGGREVRTRTEPVPRGQHGVGLRRRARCGPWRGVPTRWRDRHESAYADGSRGSWPDDGCSAGKYACSRGSPLLIRPGWPAECMGGWGSAAIGDPRGVPSATGTDDPGRHGHAKTADRPVPRYASAVGRVKPAPATRHTEGCCGANITHSEPFPPRHAACGAPISPERANFLPFRLPRCSAVVNVPPRPIPCPQVVDNYVDKAQWWTRHSTLATGLNRQDRRKGCGTGE